MANQDIKQITTMTGTFQALTPRVDRGRSSGNVAPESGKDRPAEVSERPDPAELAAKLNVANQSIGRDLRFKVDMNSGQSVIQVLDRDTGEIIREIPPEKAQISMSGNGEMYLRLYDAKA